MVTTLLMTILTFTWRKNKNKVQEIKEKYDVTAFATIIKPKKKFYKIDYYLQNCKIYTIRQKHKESVLPTKR